MTIVSDDFWWRLELPFSCEFEETLLWKLSQLGIHRNAIQFVPENPLIRSLFVWLPSNEWSETDREHLIVLLKLLAKNSDLDLKSYCWEKIENEDWSLSWKKHWEPDPVGRTLLVLPAWLEVPDLYSHRQVLRLDPGGAFGTGSHPTTRLCLEAIEQEPPVDLTVLDLGCGSGLLGIAAVSLGAQKVFAADLDSMAVSSTKENFALNHLAPDCLDVGLGSIELLQLKMRGNKGDLLLCNILASVIEALAPKFKDLLNPTGKALLSGVLIDQAPRLIAVLEGLDWKITEIVEKERWCLLKISSPY